jgi:hypothetical protein
MGVANRDASQLTLKKRNKAHNAYSNNFKAAVLTGNAALTPPAGTSAQVVSEIKLGCTACYIENNNDADPNQQRYPRNFSSGKNTGTS